MIKKTIYEKYAQLLVDYSLYLKKGEKLFIKSTTLAEPLIREVYKVATQRGAHVETFLDFEDKTRILLDHGDTHQLEYVSPLSKHVYENFDAYLNVMAPFNLRALQNVDEEKMKLYKESGKAIMKVYSERTAAGSLKRSLCQYPNHANAQEAGMSLSEYEDFVFNACHLYADDPAAEWQKIHDNQQAVVDLLNTKKKVRYKNPHSDIEFSVDGRTWINSDGKNNMPSGEVFSAPVEDSVNGKITFDYPSIYMGQEVQGVTLEVKDGEVIGWDADRGKETLDKIFNIPGAKFFGEVAIATNYGIQTPTKNILFDEKIGGTIHMAIGQSYLHCGGKNNSSVHWDMIADMKDGGQIYADDELIYENGKFIF